jgi:uncharacterized protein (TIGR02285 family)
MNILSTWFRDIASLRKYSRRAMLAKAVSGLLALVSAFPTTSVAEPLLMVYREKPPYSYTDQGVQKGFLLERTKQILGKAGIQSSFEIMPPKRIFAEIEANTREICSFGWYKTPEREKYARFTQPIHKDRPHIVLAAPSSAAAIKRHATLKALFTDKKLTLAVVDGTSYGPELDKLISVFPGTIDRALVSPLQVAQKVTGKRADFMFMDQDDYEYLLATDSSFKNEKLVRINFPDMPPGLLRYILCGQRVSDDVIGKLNAGITKVNSSGKKY